MSQHNADFSKSSKEQKSSKQPYHSPKLYLLGSLNEIQAGTRPAEFDGPDKLSYYN